LSALRALIASLLILGAGVAALALATGGFRAFTTETARRLDVRAHPRTVPDVPLETANGRHVRFDSLRGRWLLVDFVYTSCFTYCPVQGRDFARLQDRLAGPIDRGRALLLSISFDPARDGPTRLAEYQQHAGDRGAGWIAARPTDAGGLAALVRTFGVTAIPDGQGGFVHNAAIAVVDPDGRLVAIMDWDDPRAAARYVEARLGT
jgi:protein SCO1/2